MISRKLILHIATDSIFMDHIIHQFEAVRPGLSDYYVFSDSIKFIKNKICFSDISKIIIEAVNRFENVKINNIEDLFYIKKEVSGYLNESYSF